MPQTGVFAFGTLSRVPFAFCVALAFSLVEVYIKIPLNMLWLYFCLCYLEWMLFARVVLGTPLIAMETQPSALGSRNVREFGTRHTL